MSLLHFFFAPSFSSLQKRSRNYCYDNGQNSCCSFRESSRIPRHDVSSNFYYKRIITALVIFVNIWSDNSRWTRSLIRLRLNSASFDTALPLPYEWEPEGEAINRTIRTSSYCSVSRDVCFSLTNKNIEPFSLSSFSHSQTRYSTIFDNIQYSSKIIKSIQDDLDSSSRCMPASE